MSTICANITDEDPSLRIESFAMINLRGVSTKLNKYIDLASPWKRTRNSLNYSSILFAVLGLVV